MLSNINFTDPQGLTHTNAVFLVRSATKNVNTTTELLLDTNDWTTVNETITDHTPYISFQMFYWASPETKAAGAFPYILANTENAGMDYFFTLTPAYDGLTTEQQVEKYLVDVVLPPMLNV